MNEQRMTKDITHMPGRGCKYFQSGRCLYRELLNPGYDPSFKCAILAECEDRFDEFVSRADLFHLSPQKASKIWEKRVAELLKYTDKCRAYVACDDNELGCIHAHGYLCLCSLPECRQRCSCYVSANTKAEG